MRSVGIRLCKPTTKQQEVDEHVGHTADDPGSGDTAGRAAGRFMSHVGHGTGARFCFGLWIRRHRQYLKRLSK